MGHKGSGPVDFLWNIGRLWMNYPEMIKNLITDEKVEERIKDMRKINKLKKKK